MSDVIEKRLGPLRSTMQLTLHTFHALRIWDGRAASEGKPAIIGFTGFASAVGKVNRGVKLGDPYADLWMLKIQEKLQACKAELALIQDQLDLLMSAFPDAISAEENFNVQPVTMPIAITSQFGFLAVYLLITYDDIVRRLLQAHHVALIDRREMERRIHAGARELRSLFGLPRRYRFSGVSRADFALDNAQARHARERLGALPPEVMNGTLRAEFSPPVTWNQAVPAVDGVALERAWSVALPGPHGQDMIRVSAND